MASYKDVLRVADQEVGVTERPSGSNKQKYGEAYGLNGQPWCVIFCWYCIDKSGASLLFYGGKKTASCSALKKYAVANKQWVTSDYRPGDFAMMNFSGGSSPQHIGIVESIDGDILTTIEGNTSFDDQGSQSNGGAVARKKRNLKYIVGAYRPFYDENTTEYKEDKKVMISARQIKRNSTGDAVKVLQAALNALQNAKLVVDGDFGAKTEQALRVYQFDHKLACGSVDGICGKKTWESLLS